MKIAFGLIFILALATTCVAQPAVSQVVAFWCNQNYTNCPNGWYATLPPVQLSDGNLYVSTWWGGQGNPNAGGTIFRAAPSGQGFIIHTFQPTTPNGGFPNGNHPVISLTQGTDGNLYGVTETGASQPGRDVQAGKKRQLPGLI